MKKDNQPKRNRSIVLHLVTSLDFGGIERRMEVVARNQQYSKNDLIFCAIGGGGETEKRLKSLGANVICLNKDVKIPNFFSVMALFRLFRRVRPQVVHTHGAEANFHGLIAAWLAHIPVRIGEEIGTPSHSKVAQWVFRFVYRFSQIVIGGSNPVISWLVSSREVPAKKVRKVHNPLELPSVRDRYTRDEVLRLCYVGRMEAVKNPEILIDVIQSLCCSGSPVEMWMIGDGSQRHMLEEKVKKADLGSYIKFFGYQENPFDWIKRCDVFVQPSLAEGFSNALVEAMGCGVPVIVTETGAAPEIVQHGVTGWLVKSGDVGSLVEAVIKANHLKPEDLVLMGKAARLSVENRFEPKKYIFELDKIYLGAVQVTRGGV